MNAADELADEEGGRYGDPRKCPRHGTVTSSPDGMFDAPCGRCEAEGERWLAEELEKDRNKKGT